MSLAGCLLGTAVGDALGLPYEGLSRRRAERLLGPPDRFRLIGGRGMISDDTEHACITAQALIASGADPDVFAKELARRLRRWLFALPPGAGLATLRGIGKTALGVPPDRSGVRSAGNGPAMRAAILGAAVDEIDRLRELVRSSTVITHRDARAEWGAFAVALAARHARVNRHPNITAFVDELACVLPAEAAPLLTTLRRAAGDVPSGRSVCEFAASLGLDRGVTGYINHTVPVALYAWFRYPADLRSAVIDSVRCGGDTDSVAAIAGGVIGAGLHERDIPEDLLAGLLEWPRNADWMRTLAAQLESVRENRTPQRPAEVSFVASACRNVALLVIVLGHGLRRGFPPY